MKKIGFLLAVFILFSFITVSAAEDTTICILPEDFQKSLGTFTITKNEPNINGFRDTVLKGRIDNDIYSTVPAQVNVDIPKDGQYNVWARSRDFDTSPGVRKLRLVINRTSFKEILGDHLVNGWKWEICGTVNLNKGISTLKVMDVAAYYGRIDMIIITDNLSYTPPSTSDELTKIAQNHRMKDTGVVPETILPQVKPNVNYKSNKFYTTVTSEAFKYNLGTWSLKSSSNSRQGAKILTGRSDKQVNLTQPCFVHIGIPETKSYYFWFRTLDYLEEGNARSVSAKIDDKTLDKNLVEHASDGWAWEMRKVENLSKGYHTLSFVDLTANSPAIDYILITDDEAFIPNNDSEDMTLMVFDYPFAPWNYGFPPTYKSYLNIESDVKKSDTRPNTDVALKFNDKYLVFDSNPYIVKGKVIAPAEALFKALGYTVSTTTNSVICSKNGVTININQGDKFALVNKKKVELESIPSYEGTDLMVPVSFIKYLNPDVKIEKLDDKTIHLMLNKWE